MLAEDGPRGLSHLKVDRRAGVADGTTSFYYRTRVALLHGVADQLVRYDDAAFTEAFDSVADGDGDAIAAVVARQVLSIRDEPQQSRTRARLELTMLARRDADLAADFQPMDVSFRAVVERLVVALQAGDGPMEAELLDEQVSVVLAYLGGLILAFANDSAGPLTSEDIRRQIRAMVRGVAIERSGAR